jgi:hypothetical protein
MRVSRRAFPQELYCPGILCGVAVVSGVKFCCSAGYEEGEMMSREVFES